MSALLREIMPDNSENTGAPDGLIQSPDITESGKPEQRAIKDAAMASNVIKQVIAANRDRNTVNSRILAKYNAERPNNMARLEAEGLGWKQNFTTKPLPSMIEKVAPRFTEAVHNTKYLTNSSLSSDREGSTEKTEKFRDLVTKAIRSHRSWRTLIEDIAFTNALFGHVVVGWLDEFSALPKAFAQDESFVTDGAPIDSSTAQVVVLKEVYLPHELYAVIKDRETAKDAGWNIEATITAINNASPSQIRDMLNVGATQETWYQNAQRELSVGASYMANANAIVVYTLLAQEVTGKVSHYRLVQGEPMQEIFSKDDRFDNMESCLSFFAFQRGNGKLHGSKGIGRDIYELAGMIDRSRNEVVDRSILSGKTLIQGDPRQIQKFKMHVVGAAVVIPTGWNVLEQKFDGNVEPFLKMDAYFAMLVDQLIGSVSPPRGEGMGEAFRSPQAWQLLAAREEEGKDAKIARFLEQLLPMLSEIQQRLCNADNDDPIAKKLQEDLKKVMTREEIDELANSPIATIIPELTPIQRQMISAVAAEKKGHPLYNQRQLEVEDLTARIGADFAKRVLLPENDPTEQAEQMRLQQLEAGLLMQGQPVPVSTRDGHVIHIKIVIPLLEQLGAAMMEGSSDTKAFEATMAHLTEHYNKALQLGVPKEQLADAARVVKESGKVLAKLKELDEQAAQLQQQSQAHDAGMEPPSGEQAMM